MTRPRKKDESYEDYKENLKKEKKEEKEKLKPRVIWDSFTKGTYFRGDS